MAENAREHETANACGSEHPVHRVPQKPTSMFRFTLVILSVLGGGLFLYRVYYFVFEYHGHSTVGRDAHEALMDRDAKTLLALLSDQEVKAGGLTEKNLQEFIDSYLFRGYRQVSVAEVYAPVPDFPSPSSGWYRDYKMDDGRRMHVGFDAIREGYITNCIVSLLTARLLFDDPRFFDSVSVGADVIERDISILNATGIKGVYFAGRFRTWREYCTFLRED